MTPSSYGGQQGLSRSPEGEGDLKRKTRQDRNKRFESMRVAQKAKEAAWTRFKSAGESSENGAPGGRGSAQSAGPVLKTPSPQSVPRTEKPRSTTSAHTTQEGSK